MAIINIDWYENPTPSGREKNNKLHARVVSYQNTTTDEVVARIHEYSSLTEGDVRAALSGLSDALAAALSEGRRVHLEGIGYFTPTLSTTEEVDATTKRRGAKVGLKTVRFRPDKDLKRRFRPMHFNQALVPNRSSKLSDAEIDLRLTQYFAAHSYLTRRALQGLCGMVVSTAGAKLRQLRAAGRLLNIGTSNQPLYVPAPGFYGRMIEEGKGNE
jgi:predicted histone-like DNA-binding protein